MAEQRQSEPSYFQLASAHHLYRLYQAVFPAAPEFTSLTNEQQAAWVKLELAVRFEYRTEDY
jgi:hypothetical protein